MLETEASKHTHETSKVNYMQEMPAKAAHLEILLRAQYYFGSWKQSSEQDKMWDTELALYCILYAQTISAMATKNR